MAANTTLNGSLPGRGLGGDLCGELEVREAGHREDRQLLAAHQCGQRVDGGDAGEHRVGGRLTVGGLSGEPETGMVSGARIGGPPSAGSPRPLHTRPSHCGPTGIRSGLPLKSDPGRCGVHPAGSLEHLDNREVTVHLEDKAVPLLAGRRAGWWRTRPSRPRRPLAR